jgi:hypothetical protein
MHHRLVPPKNITTFTLNTWKWQVSLLHFQRSIYREYLLKYNFISGMLWKLIVRPLCDLRKFWIDDGFIGLFHTARDYTLQFTITNMVIFSHAFFLLLGSSSQQWTYSSSSGFRNCPGLSYKFLSVTAHNDCTRFGKPWATFIGRKCHIIENGVAAIGPAP